MRTAAPCKCSAAEWTRKLSTRTLESFISPSGAQSSNISDFASAAHLAFVSSWNKITVMSESELPPSAAATDADFDRFRQLVDENDSWEMKLDKPTLSVWMKESEGTTLKMSKVSGVEHS